MRTKRLCPLLSPPPHTATPAAAPHSVCVVHYAEGPTEGEPVRGPHKVPGVLKRAPRAPARPVGPPATRAMPSSCCASPSGVQDLMLRCVGDATPDSRTPTQRQCSATALFWGLKAQAAGLPGPVPSGTLARRKRLAQMNPHEQAKRNLQKRIPQKRYALRRKKFTERQATKSAPKSTTLDKIEEN